MNPVSVVVCGAGGRMGQEVLRLIEDDGDLRLAAAVDSAGADNTILSLQDVSGGADLLIDFSHHSAVWEIAAFGETRALPLVIATTGHTAEEEERIRRASARVPVFHAANMSLGVALLAKLVRETAGVFQGSDVEIIEKHHNRKVDAPSGTALLLAAAVQERRPDARLQTGRAGMGRREPGEIGIHSLRMGNVVGEHEVIFSTDSQTITLRHEAHDRALFAEGALAAARFLLGKAPGLYTMQDLLAT
jgi:4-hydroxy-tetrahydrodipicolinate reductase